MPLRFLILPLTVCLIIAIYNIIKQASKQLKIKRERDRREAEHREYMSAYNTRRQLYDDVYTVSRKFALPVSDDKQIQENISYCREDDEVEIEFDQGRKRYAAASNGGEIGFLPADANDALSKARDCKAIITQIGLTNTDKYFVHVTVYSNE